MKESDCMEPKIVGIMFKYKDGDVSYWNGFDLTEEEQEAIGSILSKHDTEGYSARGTLEDVRNEI